MDASTILRTLRDRGVSIRVKGDRLICTPGSLVKDLACAIRENKAAILAELKRGGAPYPDDDGRVKCVYCIALVDGVCSATRETMYGISLLRSCRDYEPARKEGLN